MPHSDSHYMKIALQLGARGLGLTAPNPSVGCVIVRDGMIVGRGRTARGGRPHAEPQALAQAGSQAEGATAYVTLEPCSHHGKTPPCADALIKAGITRAVIALEDPHPDVAGNGIAMLRNAGIEVLLDIEKESALQQHKGFLLTTLEQRPMVTVKLATSQDEKIARPKGQEQWITGECARHFAHKLRYTHDAILVGSGTVLADNPLLTCRLPGLEDASPTRIILDRRLRIPTDSALVQSAKHVPLWIVTAPSQLDSVKGERLRTAGAELIPYDGEDTAPLLTLLATRGITRLLVEGGREVASRFVNDTLVDELIWIQAPVTIGESGTPALSDRKLSDIVSSSYATQSYMLGDNNVTLAKFRKINL